MPEPTVTSWLGPHGCRWICAEKRVRKGQRTNHSFSFPTVSSLRVSVLLGSERKPTPASLGSWLTGHLHWNEFRHMIISKVTVCVCVCACARARVCLGICLGVCIWVSLCLCMCVSLSICLYLNICVSICV